MLKQKPNRVVIDTNVWISFLIGKELHGVKGFISNGGVKIILTKQLIDEIRLVTAREKLKKYFNQDKVSELIALLDVIAEYVEIIKVEKICRDSKDDFLLALCKASKADYLITGDKDLLVIGKYRRTKIVTAKRFNDLL